MMGDRSDLGLCPMVGFGSAFVECSGRTIITCVELLTFTSKAYPGET